MHTTTICIHVPQPTLRLPSFEQAARRRRARLDHQPTPRPRIASASHGRRRPEANNPPEGRKTQDTRFLLRIPPTLYLG